METFDVASIQALIGTVGFPILAFLICAWFLKYTWDKSQASSEKTADELTKLTNAVNNNTASLTVLTNLIMENQKRDRDG